MFKKGDLVKLAQGGLLYDKPVFAGDTAIVVADMEDWADDCLVTILRIGETLPLSTAYLRPVLTS